MSRTVLAIDLGGTNLRAAAVDENGSVLARARGRTPDAGPPEEVSEAIAAVADECRSSVEGRFEIAAVAAAVPATVNFEEGLMLKAPNLPSLDGFAMRDFLSRVFGVDAVVENDANSAAVGESWLGALRGIRNSATVTLGTGVGGGLIIDGSVFRGVDGTAGEIGHICVEPNGVRCGCGSRGCVEQYASATAIVRMVRDLSPEFADSALAACDGLKASAVFEAARGGDRLARSVFEQMGRYLGIALADLINLLNPEAIVIGGGVAGAWEYFIAHVMEEIHGRAFREPAARARILKAELGDDAGLLGAARLAFDRVG